MDARQTDKSKLPSRHVTEGPERAPHRSYLYAMGLTTVGQRPDEQAELATKMLLDELDGEAGAVQSAVAPHELIVRRTTAPPQS